MSAAILNVFTYHRVLPGSCSGVSCELFRRQIDYLQRHYTLLDLAGLLRFLRHNAGSRGPFAVITFDDGWLDAWLHVTPILRARRAPAILALSTAFLHDAPLRSLAGGSSAAVPDREALNRALYGGDRQAFLSRREVRAMADTGLWSIQAHGHRHARSYYRIDPARGYYPRSDDVSLPNALEGREPISGVPCGELVSELACRRKRLPNAVLRRLGRDPADRSVCGKNDCPLEYAETGEQYQKRIRADLGRCRTEITAITGAAPVLLFWPWGDYSETSLAAARETGFQYTFSTAKGMIRRVPAQAVLPRIGVGPNMSKFRRNAAIFRHPFMAAMHRIISPSPSGLREDGTK